MVELDLIGEDSEILHEISKEVEFPLDFNTIEEIKALEDLMIRTDPNAQGISMVQAGILKRIAIIKYRNQSFVIINPIIKNKHGVRSSRESCLTIDNDQNSKIYYKLERPMSADVEYYSMDGKKITIKPEFKQLRVFCHEVDHMDGILIKDIGKPLKNRIGWIMMIVFVIGIIIYFFMAEYSQM